MCICVGTRINCVIYGSYTTTTCITHAAHQHALFIFNATSIGKNARIAQLEFLIVVDVFFYCYSYNGCLSLSLICWIMRHERRVGLRHRYRRLDHQLSYRICSGCISMHFMYRVIIRQFWIGRTIDFFYLYCQNIACNPVLSIDNLISKLNKLIRITR